MWASLCKLLPRSRSLVAGAISVQVVLLGGSLWAVAQTTPASIQGIVRSADGSPLSGTAVLAKNIATGRSHTTTADTQGQFRLSDLAPGSYELQVSRSGFSSQTEPSLELSPGQSLARNFVMEPSQQDGARQVESAGDSSARAAAAASRINESQLAGLPLNGRSYNQLATLQAGISDPGTASGSRGVSGGNLTVSGGRSISNNYHLDGTNIMDTENKAPSSAAGVQLGSDAVYQVQVFSTTYSAEYGRGSGGVLNSITRSGSNEFHGSFFEYLRNSKLDARNFFDYDPQNPTVRSQPPPFKRNQFGFTITGPVVKDKTFFMASYEGLRDRLTSTDLSFFPDADSRLGRLTNAAGELIQTIQVDPRVKPYLDLYPIPNETRFGRGVGRNFAPQYEPTDENFATFRVDQKISDRDGLFGRYTFDDATGRGDSNNYIFTSVLKSRQQYLTVAGSHIFSLNVLDAFRFGYTHPVSHTTNKSILDPIDTKLFFVPTATQLGQILMPGISVFGPNPSHPSGMQMSSFQFSDDLLVQKGPHALKFGFQLHRYHWDVYSSWHEGGVWSFNSLESFLQGDPGIGKRGTSLQVALPGSDNSHAFRQTYAGFYVQDEFNASSRLQFNLGLRYEFATQLQDQKNKIVFLRDLLRDTEAQVGPTFLKDNPSLRSFAPRVGINWTPWVGGNTVFSWGFGIYYDQIIGNIASQRKSSAPFHNIAINPNFDALGIFPDALQGAVGVPALIQVMDYLGMKTPTVYRYNFSIQQQLPAGWRLQAGYVGARGNNLFRRYEANQYPVPEVRPDGSLFFPAQCPPSNQPPIAGCRAYAGPMNPALGSISMISSDAQSFYNSFQVSANKSMSQGLSLQASYSFSKSIDDNSTGPDGNTGQYPLMRTLDRGLSDFDMRQRISGNFFYTLPFGGGQRWAKSGLLSKLAGGWRIGGITSIRAGLPFTPSVRLGYTGYLFEPIRPNLAPGLSNNPTSGTSIGCGSILPGQPLAAPDLYFDPCVLEPPPPGTMGNLGRNTVIAPWVASLDVSLQREFLLDAKRRLQFRAEIFNLPNHTSFNKNILSSLITFSGGAANRAATTGRIGSTATTSRQIQFALRFSF